MLRQHVMADIECFGIKPGCMLISIGACVFSPQGVLDTFYQVIDCKTASGFLEPGSVLFWMQASDEARREVYAPEKPLPEKVVLANFALWFIRQGRHSLLWTRGPNFDPPILESAFERNGIAVPWVYDSHRDVRTIVDAASLDLGSIPKLANMVQHHALHDALWQANYTTEALIKLGRWKRKKENNHELSGS